MRHCPRSLANVNSSNSHNHSHGQDYGQFIDMKTEVISKGTGLQRGGMTLEIPCNPCGLCLSLHPHPVSLAPTVLLSSLLHGSFSNCEW